MTTASQHEKTGKVAIHQINTTLNSVPKIVVFKIQQDPSTTTQLSHGNYSCQQMNDHDEHNKIGHQILLRSYRN